MDKLHPCVFFDRDGIVNHPPDDAQRYVLHEDDLRILPGFVASLRLVLSRGYKAVIVTNQAGVSRGRMTQDDLDRIHAKLQRHLAAEKLALNDIYECTSFDDAHPNRKPNPGMLLDAAREHALDLARSWMIGDSEKDIQAGRRAGVAKTVRVKPLPAKTDADFRVDTMDELVDLLAQELPPVSH
ncbi:MAG: HAD-IIIA family hydrolase [Kiritimatiellae bacterium]|nr:HAD-IIIA family hydrolase [Kiritimatiellia bacterium]